MSQARPPVRYTHTRTVTRKVKRTVTTHTYRVSCEHCGKRFTAKRSTRRFCSDTCRVRGHRARRGAEE